MTEPDWSTLPISMVEVARCVFPCHDLDPAHHHPDDGRTLTAGPIRLERLVDGSLFVHDGRHRLIRAEAAGERLIAARVWR